MKKTYAHFNDKDLIFFNLLYQPYTNKSCKKNN